MINGSQTAGELKAIFADELALEPTMVTEDLQYNVAPEWDSAAHMYLVAAIEEKYDVTIPDADIAEMTSFPAAVTIVSQLIGPK